MDMSSGYWQVEMEPADRPKTASTTGDGLYQFKVMPMAQSGAPPPADLLGIPPWCTCGNCRDMPTLLERKCCGQEPNHCVCLLPQFSLFCLDEGNLRIHRQYWEDLMAVRPRYAAYRHFIFWQHGAFGRGNRLVIPSCCVWAVRDRYQDPYGQYKGFVPGR
uniref:P2X purinoreceptor 7 intracellular domain-containing protein n=1 Tax=Nothobranchius furzeri TaxID=105023 RepID=A0A8C6KBU7_NOTFU